MIEIIVIECDNLNDLIRALSKVIRRLKRINRYSVDRKERSNKTISARNLLRFEKHSRFYTFVYDDKTIVMDSRTARKHLSKMDTKGFIGVNKVDVVNMSRVEFLDGNGLRLDGTGRTICVSRSKRALLEKYMDIVYNQKMISGENSDAEDDDNREIKEHKDHTKFDRDKENDI